MYMGRSKVQWVGFTFSALAMAIASERLSAAEAAIGATEHVGMVLVHRQRRGQDSGFAENALALGLVAGFSPQVAPRGFSILQHRHTPGEDALPEDIPQE